MRYLFALSALSLALCACDPGVMHVARFPNGRVKETWFEKGPMGGPTLREGEFQSFLTDGRRESSIAYRRGRREGDARIWDKDGRLAFRGRYHDDFLLRERRFDAAGAEILDKGYAIRREKVRVPGPEGDSVDAEEICAMSGKGATAVKHGLCRVEYADGPQLSTRYYSQGRLQGPLAAYYPDGARWMSGAYAKGEPDGAWTTWSSRGKARWSARFSGGLRNGPWKEWFPGGGPKSDARFLAGKRDGPYQEWYPNGRLRLSCEWRAGAKDGEETAWYPDGRKLYSARYAKGRLEGDFRQWHPGGTPRLHCRFHLGRKDGLSRVWDRGGALIEQANYAGGRLNGPYRSWAPDGKPLVSKQFNQGAVAYDSKAKELLDLLGVDADGPSPSIPVGLAGFYWGMDRKECEANLAVLQAGGVRAEADGFSARFTAFADLHPTAARVRLQFNPQGELWGIRLELEQKSPADYFQLCENLEAEIGGGLGTTGMRKASPGGPAGRPGDEASPYFLTRRRDWGTFSVTSGSPAVRQLLPVLTAESFSPGGAGWFRFMLANNLYREYVNPGNVSVTPPVWKEDAFLAGR